jgi:hypothetical protein
MQQDKGTGKADENSGEADEALPMLSAMACLIGENRGIHPGEGEISQQPGEIQSSSDEYSDHEEWSSVHSDDDCEHEEPMGSQKVCGICTEDDHSENSSQGEQGEKVQGDYGAECAYI